MTRMTDGEEGTREKIENALALMAHAKKLIELVEIRVDRAAISQRSLMEPAQSDLEQIKSKLNQAQRVLLNK